MDERLAMRMLERIEKTIDEHWDRVHVFQLCQSCSPRALVMGTAEMAVEHDFYVV